MARITVVALLAGMAVAASGCGTFADIMCGPVGEPRFYAGVRTDIDAIKERGIALGPDDRPSPASIPLLVADIPASAIADTLLLPVVFRAKREWPEINAQRQARDRGLKPPVDGGMPHDESPGP